MNRKLIILVAFIFAFGNVSAQKMGFGNGGQQKETVEKMTPTERIQLIRQMRENLMIEDLKIPEEKREHFSKIYAEYQESQLAIKNKFKSDFDPDTLSDEAAKHKLNESFSVGEQLMENRRKYAEKMQVVLSPQQVLKLYQNEGAWREKLMDRKLKDNENRAGQGLNRR